jgi:hypothetical protein
MPRHRSDLLTGTTPDGEESPFFVLLEDDTQITKISVSTDRLLELPSQGEHINDVHLVIGIKLMSSR